MLNLVAMGHASDPTLVHFVDTATRLGAPVLPIDVREIVDEGHWSLALAGPGSPSFVEGPRLGRVDLTHLGSVYSRVVSLESTERDERSRARWRNFSHGIRAWLELHPWPVVNRPGRHAHNVSKPLHEAWMISEGLRTPASITSCDRDLLRAFVEGGPTICKACSGVRGEAFRVTSAAFDRYSPEQGPVHLQRLVPGEDYRVHVVGDDAIAVRIDSDSIDYRASGSCATYTRVEIPADLAQALTESTRRLGVLLAGWDLKRDNAGQFWVLEANLMPAYRIYDRHCSGDITGALVRAMADAANGLEQEGWTGGHIPREAFADTCALVEAARPVFAFSDTMTPGRPFITRDRRADTVGSLADRRNAVGFHSAKRACPPGPDSDGH